MSSRIESPPWLSLKLTCLKLFWEILEMDLCEFSRFKVAYDSFFSLTLFSLLTLPPYGGLLPGSELIWTR